MKRNGRLAALAVALAVGLLAGGAARAQETDTFDAQNFKPALSPHGYVTVEGAKFLGPFAPHIAAYFSWAHNPLRLTEPRPGFDERDVVRDLSAIDFVLALGLVPIGNGGLELAVGVPFYVDINGLEIADVNDEGDLRGLPEEAFGDLRTAIKLTLLDREDDPIGIAAKVEAQWPVDREQRDSFNTDRHFQLKPSIVIDKKMSILRIAAEVGYEWLDGSEFQVAGVQVDDRLWISAAVGIEPFDEKVPLAIVAEAIHWTRWENPWDHEEESPVELFGAIKYAGTIFFELGAGGGLNEGVGAPDARVFGALGFTL